MSPRVFRPLWLVTGLLGVSLGATTDWLSTVPVNARSSQASAVTFSKHVAPIVFKHCAGCHRPGQPAPFSLLTYQDARPRARQIASVTERRVMPPWLPTPGLQSFSNERRLTPTEIGLIQEWARQGAVEGDPKNLPPRPQFADGWQLGQPDLIVTMPAPYTVRAGSDDVFRNFVLPVPLEGRRYVRAVELRGDFSGVLHHAVMGIDKTRLSRHRDQEDPEPGFEGMFPGPAQGPEGHFLGWTPGRLPFFLPEDMFWKLDRGSDLVLQLHLMPASEPERVQLSVGFFFGERPPTHTPFLLRIGSEAIDIAPGAREYVSTDAYRLPVDVEVLAIYPHAHYLAHDMSGSARLPDGQIVSLIHIKQWDFFWQDEYRYAKSIFLPKGSVLEMRYTFDNSARNPRNPHRPPKRVVFGPHTSDEMGDLWIQVLPRNRRDLMILQQDFGRREIEAGIAGYETIIRARPTEADSRRILGSLYARAGKLEAAISSYEEALRLDPSDAMAHYNLGVAMQSRGQPQAAIDRYAEALRLRPGLPEAEHTWGHALLGQGKPDAAIEHFRRATKIWPEYADAYNSWAATLLGSGRVTEAIDRFRQVLQIDPDHRPALNNLGSVLAKRGELDEAIRLLTHAVDLYPDDSDSRRNLAAAMRLREEKARNDHIKLPR